MKHAFDNTAIAFSSRNNGDLRRANYLFSFMASPLLTTMGVETVRLCLNMHLPIKWMLKNTIFAQFCGGETLEETAALTYKLGKYNVDTILDYGIEGKEDEESFDKAVPEFVKAIRFAAAHEHIPFISLKITGFARFALLEKMSSGSPISQPEQEEWARVHERIDVICGQAALSRIMVLIDAEETWILDPCNELADAMMAKYNRGKVVVFNTFQLYCRGTLSFLEASILKAKEAGYLLGAKLVRGAYMEKERKRAAEKNYPDPIQPDKASTDRDFDAAVDLCLHNLDKLSVFIGSHNEWSNQKASEALDQLGIAHDDKRIYFSQLLGMSDHISFNLASRHYNVSKYMPYGPVKDVIPYLMRRARENTSIAGQTSRELSLIRSELRRRKTALQ